MKLYSGNENYKLYHGNMLDLLDVIGPESIDSIVTDPPYELGFMNKNWDNSGIAFQKETWEKCFTALKRGGYLLAFGGSRTYHRIACAIEDAGFEIRDTIMWIYGSGFPKSMNVGKAIESKLVNGSANPADFKNLDGEKTASGNWGLNKAAMEYGARPTDYAADKHLRIVKVDYQTEEGKKWDGWGTCLKPAYEPIIVARKPCEGTTTDNVLKYGVGGFNIDECRIGNEERSYKGMSSHKPENAGCFRDDNWQPKDIEVTVNGRFPANVILTYDDADFEEVCNGFPGEEKCTARYFMNCKHTGKDEGIWKQLLVNNAESNSEILKATKGNIVQMNVEDLLKELKDHYAKYVDNQLDLIETPIVQDIAKMLTWDSKIETSQVIQDFIINSKKCIQFLNLVQFVEKMDSIDTTQTTQNLLKLFGYVKVVITNYILGNIEYDQKRYIYTPKASKKDRDDGLKIKNIHPTVKPTELMQYLVRLVTPNKGIVLDPFNGSGSTGKAVMWENKERSKGYKYIGIELTEEYLPISKARIEYVSGAETNLEETFETQSAAGDKQMNIFDLL